ncbi:MAG: porin family protein [Hyphomicrobiaceae bacterium]
MRWIVSFCLLFAVIGTAASAADLGGDNRGSIKDEPPYVSRFNWTGAYVGAQIGYGWADTEASTGPIAGINQTYEYESSGFQGGFHGGYNLQNGNFVYGIEADIDFADLDGSGVGSLGTLSHQTEVNWIGSLRARVGFAADRTLFYVTGGWAFGEVDVTQRSLIGPAISASFSDIRNGWTLGGGVERAFTNNLTARLEYRYTDLGDYDVSDSVLSALDNSDVTIHSIRAGVSYRF